VKDAQGAPAQPYRAVDTIELLLQRGTITKEAAIAADQFRRAFRVAALDPLRAADLSRVPGARGRAGDPPTWARERASAMPSPRSAGRVLWLHHAFGISSVSNGASGGGAESRRA